MRRLLILLTLLLGLAVPAPAAEPIAGKEFGQRLMGYYQHPDPQAAFGWLLALDDAAMAREDAVDLLAVFYLHVLKANPALAASFVDHAVRARPKAALGAALAIWLADLPAKEALVGRLAKTGKIAPDRLAEVKAVAPFVKEELEVVSPHDLDLLWTSFFATGDTDYVRFIAGYLPYLLPKAQVAELIRSDDPAARRAATAALLGGAAAWSLSANARVHAPVQATLAELAAMPDDPIGKAAKALLERQAR